MSSNLVNPQIHPFQCTSASASDAVANSSNLKLYSRYRIKLKIAIIGRQCYINGGVAGEVEDLMFLGSGRQCNLSSLKGPDPRTLTSASPRFPALEKLDCCKVKGR